MGAMASGTLLFVRVRDTVLPADSSRGRLHQLLATVQVPRYRRRVVALRAPLLCPSGLATQNVMHLTKYTTVPTTVKVFRPIGAADERLNRFDG